MLTLCLLVIFGSLYCAITEPLNYIIVFMLLVEVVFELFLSKILKRWIYGSNEQARK